MSETNFPPVCGCNPGSAANGWREGRGLACLMIELRQELETNTASLRRIDQGFARLESLAKREAQE